MAKIDKIKESIGYLKVIFGLFVAIDVSLVGWLFQNSDTISTLKTAFVFLAIILITIGIVLTNKKILNKIDTLEEI